MQEKLSSDDNSFEDVNKFRWINNLNDISALSDSFSKGSPPQSEQPKVIETKVINLSKLQKKIIKNETKNNCVIKQSKTPDKSKSKSFLHKQNKLSFIERGLSALNN